MESGKRMAERERETERGSIGILLIKIRIIVCFSIVSQEQPYFNLMKG